MGEEDMELLGRYGTSCQHMPPSLALRPAVIWSRVAHEENKEGVGYLKVLVGPGEAYLKACYDGPGYEQRWYTNLGAPTRRATGSLLLLHSFLSR